MLKGLVVARKALSQLARKESGSKHPSPQGAMKKKQVLDYRKREARTALQHGCKQIFTGERCDLFAEQFLCMEQHDKNLLWPKILKPALSPQVSQQPEERNQL